MTNEGKMYAFGAVVIAVLGAVLLLWSVLLWIGLGVLALTVLIVGWVVWGKVHQRRIQTRKDKAEAAKLEYEAQHAQALAAQACAVAEQQRAIANQQHAQAAALWQQTKMIPRTMVGVMLEDLAQRERVMVWPASHITYNHATETPPPTALPAPALPGPTDLVTLLGTFRPTPAQILLALTGQGLLLSSLAGLSHVALAAPTGGGKSSTMRLLLAQVLACQVVVWLADPHYTPVDPQSGEDWRMIEARLAEPPFIEPGAIREALQSLVAEMRRRYAGRAKGERWTPCYLAIDEWPAILGRLGKREADEVVESAGYLLREGRKVDVNLITSSQDFLVETIGGSGEIRANLRTAFYGGGGLTTARRLLDDKITLPEQPLGKGLMLLRSEEALPKPALVRVPYASNEALYRLLPLDQAEERYYAAFPPLPAHKETPKEAGDAPRAAVESDSPASPAPAPALVQPISAKPERLGEWERKFIAQRYRKGEDRTAIRDQLRELRGGFSNKLWGELKTICDAIDGEEAAR